MKFLYLIPARGGSKGIPGKNIKPLAGKPLINYAIDLARRFAKDGDICLSTDNTQIIDTAQKHKLKVPFIRPDSLSSDNSGSYEVMLHAVNHFESEGKKYDAIVLLQPTSPFRLKTHLTKAIKEFKDGIDLVVSVKESHANPYWNLFKENKNGFLEKYFPGTYTRRQDTPKSFEYNGAIYIIRISELKKRPLHEFERIKKLEMDEISSVDIDKPIDWLWAEYLINNNYIKFDYE
jgi:CMP-N,N'-diacetyllegionaminic acid synthase